MMICRFDPKHVKPPAQQQPVSSRKQRAAAVAASIGVSNLLKRRAGESCITQVPASSFTLLSHAGECVGFRVRLVSSKARLGGQSFRRLWGQISGVVCIPYCMNAHLMVAARIQLRQIPLHLCCVMCDARFESKYIRGLSLYQVQWQGLLIRTRRPATRKSTFFCLSRPQDPIVRQRECRRYVFTLNTLLYYPYRSRWPAASVFCV